MKAASGLAQLSGEIQLHVGMYGMVLIVAKIPALASLLNIGDILLFCFFSLKVGVLWSWGQNSAHKHSQNLLDIWVVGHLCSESPCIFPAICVLREMCLG